MSHACEKCGTMLDEEQRFCPNCGTQTNQTRDDRYARFGTHQASSVNSETVKFTRRRIRGLGWLVLLALAVTTTWIYTRSRATHQPASMHPATEYSAQTQPDYSQPLPGHEKDAVTDAAEILGLDTTAAGGRLGPTPHFPPLAPGAGFTGRIPLRADLIVVNAVNDPDQGDYETIGHIESVTSESVAIEESADVPDSPSRSAAKLGASAAPATHKVNTHRTVLRSDLLHAHAVMSTYPIVEAWKVSAKSLLTYGPLSLMVFSSSSAVAEFRLALIGCKSIRGCWGCSA